jgi:Uma2 family endonuclease
MKTGADLPGRAPDIQFLSNANLSRRKKTFIERPADLVVEIISPGSRAGDRGDKFFEYEQAGVSEYWIIDLDRKQAEFYPRGSDGIYTNVSKSPDGIYRSSTLPGLWLRIEWLWQRPLPTVLGGLREWKLI